MSILSDEEAFGKPFEEAAAVEAKALLLRPTARPSYLRVITPPLFMGPPYGPDR